MRIAFCVIKNPTFGGGIEKYTAELGSRLVKRGHEVSVYCMNHYGELPREYAGMRIIGVPCLHLRSLEKITASVTSAISASLAKNLDIVHFHDLAPGSFACIPRIFAPHRCVLQFHGLGWKRSRWGNSGILAHKLLEKVSIRQSHTYTAVSKVQCDYFKEKYCLDVNYIPTAAELKPFTAAKEIYKIGLESKSYILFASRLVREKGAHYLIPAFRRLKTSQKLVIAGDVSDPAYEKQLKQLAAGDERIIFTGFVKGRMLDELFSNALVYVQPSELEGLSIALLEAMSYGNCCLVSDIPENLEAIDSAGWSFENKNIDSLTEKLNWLIDNPEKLSETGLRAKARVMDNFSWDKVASDFEDLYQKTLAVKVAA